MNDEKSEERIIELLKELVRWTKVTSLPKVKELLEEMVQSPEEKIAYTASNGKRTVREVGEIANIGKDAVARLWRNWIKSGLAEPIGVKGGGNRAKSSFSLEDFGIDLPKVTETLRKREDETAGASK